LAQFLAGVWHLIGIKRNTDEGRCLLCLGEEDIKTHAVGLLGNLGNGE